MTEKIKLSDFLGITPPTKTNQKDLEKEQSIMRSKQPIGWANQKYRKYANHGINKKKKPDFIEEENEPQLKSCWRSHAGR